ncbi:MAG: Crp/Fnr family transcriptional regulator [Bacteroidota bacterium]
MHSLQYYYQGLELSPEVQDFFSQHQEIRITKNTSLIRQGEGSRYYWIVIEGLVRSFVYSSEGEEITTGFFDPPNICLEFSSFFLHSSAVENLVSVSELSVFQVNKAIFFKYFEQCPSLQQWGRTWMVNFLINRQSYFLSNHTDDAKNRYQKRLSRLLYLPRRVIC